MKQVYSPGNAAEAHMLAHLLQQSGIQAHIHGEALQGAAGELPAGNLIQLLVADEDYERARALLLKWEAQSGQGEPSSIPGRRFRIVGALVFLTIGIMSGWGLKVGQDRTHFTFGDARVSQDQNGDGRDDATWFSHSGSEIAHKAEFDTNFDGLVDLIWRYDEVGIPTGQEWDSDFDGVFENKSRFRDGNVVLTETDTDGDAVSDAQSVFEFGVLKRNEITDPMYGYVVRIDHYDTHRLVRSEIDLDRNGFRETVRTFDRYGEIVETEARRP